LISFLRDDLLRSREWAGSGGAPPAHDRLKNDLEAGAISDFAHAMTPIEATAKAAASRSLMRI